MLLKIQPAFEILLRGSDDDDDDTEEDDDETLCKFIWSFISNHKEFTIDINNISFYNMFFKVTMGKL